MRWTGDKNSMNRNKETIWEKMNEKKHVIGFAVGIVLFIGVVIDYASKKGIPNFVFMGQYSVSNAEAYWTWVLGIGVAVVSILTFIHALDQFTFEKRVHRENKEHEKMEKFEALLSTAMDIFDKKVENEIECLRAVQIIKNIIDYTIRYERTNGEKKHVVDEVEKYKIISIDGALVLLKQHLDKVLKEERKGNRQDVKLIIEILYRNFYYKWNGHHLGQLGIYNFENLKIDIGYFDMAELSNMRFECVEFCDSKMNSVLILSDRNVFEKCIFECDINFHAKEFASIDFSECKLKGFKMQCEIGKKYGIKGDRGTRNMTIQDCIIDGYFGMSRNSFDNLKFVNSTFKRGVYMQFIRVESEFSIVNSEFEGIVDMQSSVFCWKAAFVDTVCKKLFYIWDSDFLKKERIYFKNFYVDEFERGNYNARIYANYVESKKKSEIKKLGDYFETEWNEEKDMYAVKEKSIYVSDDE